MKFVYTMQVYTPIREICLSMSIINNADETRCAGPANPLDTFSDDVLKRKFLRYVYTIQVHWNIIIEQECMFLLSQIW